MLLLLAKILHPFRLIATVYYFRFGKSGLDNCLKVLRLKFAERKIAALFGGFGVAPEKLDFEPGFAVALVFAQIADNVVDILATLG